MTNEAPISEPKDLAEWLRQKMDECQLRTYGDVAVKVGVVPQTVKNILDGKPQRYETLMLLAEAFHVEVEYLVKLAKWEPLHRRRQREVTLRRISADDIQYFPHMGHVPAGTPGVIERDHQVLIGLFLDDHHKKYIEKHVKRPFALAIVGDSMVPDMNPDDVAIVDPDRKAKPGDFVVALVDGESTIKKLVRDGERMILRPSNKKYRDIIFSEENDRIQAVVAMVIERPKPRWFI
jgi:SOS-response transcriptional repressor LexA